MAFLTHQDGIETVARFEEVIGALYSAYAWLFPDYADLWSGLSMAEKGHAKLVRELRDTRLGVSISEGRVNLPIRLVETSTAMVKQALVNAWAGNVCILDALCTASDIENALIERQFYQTIETDDVEAEKRITNIITGTEAHREAIANCLNAVKLAA